VSEKIAIFGGSFNPIHNGHIEVALRAMEECRLSKVIFLPNAVPPHKDEKELVLPEHRYNMVKLAISSYNRFDVSDYEMAKTTPSYTIDTMRYMRSEYNADLYFIIGADSLYTLNTWKMYSDLIKECKFIVADRNCNEGSDIYKAADKIVSSGGSVNILSMPKFDVTSTFIRKAISSGKDVSEYVPWCVINYIKINNLYKSNPEDQR